MPAFTVIDEPLVNAGAVAAETSIVSVSVVVPAEFLAETVKLYEPADPVAGVPDNVAVPLELSLNVAHDGTVPVVVNAGVGDPEVVTEKLKCTPT